MKKINETILNIIQIIIIISSVILSYNILLLGPIEKELRIIFIIGILLINFLFIIKYLKVKNNNTLKGSNPKPYVINSIVFIIITLLLSFTINYFYGKINKVKRDYITYSTSIVVLEESTLKSEKDLKNIKLGIIDDEESPDGYIISKEIIKDLNLEKDNELITYDSFTEMMSDLYDEKLDAIFISSNYVTMFSQIEEFKDVGTTTRVIYKRSKRLTNKDNINKTNKDILKEPFTLLLMGVDSEVNGLDNNAAFNGDSLLLITFNPKTLNATILSIPRDTYVPISCFRGKEENKITHAAWYGANCMMNTIKDLTDINIDYYVKVNFQALVMLVDAVGGVDIDVPYSFCEQDSNRRWGEHTIYVEKGPQTLNGEQALAFSRNRKTSEYCDPKYNLGERSDLVRGVHQQLVIEALLKKFKSIKSITSLNNILTSISKNFDTNMSTNDILSFYEIGKDVLKKDSTNETIVNLEKLSLETHAQMIFDESMRLPLSNQVLNENSLKDVINIMNINLGNIKPKLIKTFSYSHDEEYVKKQGGITNTPATLYKVLPNFIGQKKEVVENFANANNLKVIYNIVKSSNTSYFNNQVIAQSEPATKRVDKIINKTITVDIVEKVEATASERIDCSKDLDNTLCIMPDFENKTRLDVLNWVNKIKGISIEWITVNEEDVSKEPNTVFDQDIEVGTSLEDIKVIKIKVVKDPSL